MLFKYFLVNLALALSSATALPNPEADGSLDARDAYPATCGSGATMKYGKCVCTKETMVYDTQSKSCACPSGQTWLGTKCGQDCGKDAIYKGYSCVCKNEGQSYDSKSKTCSCPSGMEWSGYKCTYACGSDATYDSKSSKCVCKKSAMTYDTKSKTCACPKNHTYDTNSGKCKQTYY